MDKVEQIAEQIKAQGPHAVEFVKGYLDAELRRPQDRRHVGSDDYRRGYLAGVLNSDIVNGVSA